MKGKLDFVTMHNELIKYAYRKKPRLLLVKDQLRRPIQLQMKNGRETHEGWLTPTTNCTMGNNKQHGPLRLRSARRQTMKSITINTQISRNHIK